MKLTLAKQLVFNLRDLQNQKLELETHRNRTQRQKGNFFRVVTTEPGWDNEIRPPDRFTKRYCAAVLETIEHELTIYIKEIEREIEKLEAEFEK